MTGNRTLSVLWQAVSLNTELLLVGVRAPGEAETRKPFAVESALVGLRETA